MSLTCPVPAPASVCCLPCERSAGRVVQSRTVVSAGTARERVLKPELSDGMNVSSQKNLNLTPPSDQGFRIQGGVCAGFSLSFIFSMRFQPGILVLSVCVCLATETACFLSPSIPLPASASGAFLSSPRLSSLGDAAAGVGRDGGKRRIPQLSTPMMAAKPGTKALIVGAGPAGILSAHYLLRRGYDVTVAEKRDDPRQARRKDPPSQITVTVSTLCHDAMCSASRLA